MIGEAPDVAAGVPEQQRNPLDVGDLGGDQAVRLQIPPDDQAQGM
jgi:hypothetical protein